MKHNVYVYMYVFMLRVDNQLKISALLFDSNKPVTKTVCSSVNNEALLGILP